MTARSRAITIALTDDQLAHVMKGLSQRDTLAGLATDVDLAAAVADSLDETEAEALGSHSLVRGLRILAALPSDGGELELAGLARALQMAPSTVHRYLQTWIACGVVQRDERSRRYKRSSRGGRNL
jgi:hypothetical protein